MPSNDPGFDDENNIPPVRPTLRAHRGTVQVAPRHPDEDETVRLRHQPDVAAQPSPPTALPPSRKRAAEGTPDTDDVQQTPRLRFSLMFLRLWAHLKPHRLTLLVGMILILLTIIFSARVLLPWIISLVDHWNTGQDRVSYFHLDVGHNGGPSDFVTLYRKGQAIVIEFPGGDAHKAHVYIIQVADPSDHTPRIVTLHLDKNRPGVSGKPDLLVEVEDSQGVGYALHNTGDTFQQPG